MVLTGKVKKELEIDAPAEKFCKLWTSECYHLPTASPSNIQGVEVHECDWETGGSNKVWKYTVGKAETYKEKVEADVEHVCLTLCGIEGDIYKDFKLWKPVFEVTPREKGSGSVAKLSIEYENRHKDDLDPIAYMEFMASMTRDVAAHIIKA